MSNSTTFYVYGLFCACARCRAEAPGEVRYVGQTVQDLKRRLNGHKSASVREFNSNPRMYNLPLYRWMRKHGASNIRMVLLDTSESREELTELERLWIDRLGCYASERGLNATPGGRGGSVGYKHSREAIQKMRDRFSTPEARRKSSRPGGDHPRALLTDSQVLGIKKRLWSGDRATDISKEIGVAVHCVQQINTGSSWSHIPWPVGPRVQPLYRSSLSRGQIQEVKELREAGESMRRIAERMGVSVTSIHRVTKNW